MLFAVVKVTKSESKSQRYRVEFSSQPGCSRLSKLQNLKANHNEDHDISAGNQVVRGCQSYKI